MPHAPAHFRVFLSSPGDVADERALARRALQNLENQPFIRNRASVQIVAWDNPEAGTPLFANLTPQEAINRQLPLPSECDIVVVVLWIRIGTPLPDSERRPDGTTYRSGTEWEYENALRTASPRFFCTGERNRSGWTSTIPSSRRNGSSTRA